MKSSLIKIDELLSIESKYFHNEGNWLTVDHSGSIISIIGNEKIALGLFTNGKTIIRNFYFPPHYETEIEIEALM